MNILRNALLIIVSLSTSIGVAQAATKSLGDVMGEGVRSTVLKMLSVDDAIKYALLANSKMVVRSLPRSN